MKRLIQKIEQLNHKNYGLYKTLKSTYSFGDFKFTLVHVQGDPYARPSLAEVRIPFDVCGFPREWLEDVTAQIPLGDFITRLLNEDFKKYQPSEPCTGNGGRLFVVQPGQQILSRSSVSFGEKDIVVRFRLGLPGEGRRILSRAAVGLIAQAMPTAINACCFMQKSFEEKLKLHIQIYRDQLELRKLVFDAGYIGFVPNGALLPRESGLSDRPLVSSSPIVFKSPSECEVAFHLSNGKEIIGMGFKPGVTLIVGGGFHGKSTLLRALELGIYNHIAGDGREFVCVPEESIKIKAENGRPVNNVNISAFINNLPQGVDTKDFSSLNASGSTSQAAGIVEAVQCGAKILLMDEDTCATNFMIRDAKMRQLITDGEEPITPFVKRVEWMYENLGVSSILVLGGCGDYFEVAHRVIAMKNYLPVDLTHKAHEIGSQKSSVVTLKEAVSAPSESIFEEKRVMRADPKLLGFERVKVRYNEMVKLQVGALAVDIRHLEQLVCTEQVACIGAVISQLFSEKQELDRSELEKYTAPQKRNVFSKLMDLSDGYAEVRFLDLVGVLNRCPSLEVQKK